jgi:hypothetical protein
VGIIKTQQRLPFATSAVVLTVLSVGFVVLPRGVTASHPQQTIADRPQLQSVRSQTQIHVAQPAASPQVAQVDDGQRSEVGEQDRKSATESGAGQPSVPPPGHEDPAGDVNHECTDECGE